MRTTFRSKHTTIERDTRSGRVHNRRRGRALTTPIFLLLFPAFVGAAPRVEFFLHLSASMNESVEGVRGEELARAALREAVRVLPPETEVGVRVFGHRVAYGDTTASCADSELIIPFRTRLSAADLTVLDRLEPRGLTPLGRVIT